MSSQNFMELTREEKDRLAEQRMAEMRKKNEEYKKRNAEVEADRRKAESSGASVILRKNEARRNAQPESGRSSIETEAQCEMPVDEREAHPDRRSGLEKEAQGRPSRERESHPERRRGRERERQSMPNEEEQNTLNKHQLWRAERQRIDEERVARIKDNFGNFRREWDNDKIEQMEIKKTECFGDFGELEYVPRRGEFRKGWDRLDNSLKQSFERKRECFDSPNTYESNDNFRRQSTRDFYNSKKPEIFYDTFESKRKGGDKNFGSPLESNLHFSGRLNRFKREKERSKGQQSSFPVKNEKYYRNRKFVDRQQSNELPKQRFDELKVTLTKESSGTWSDADDENIKRVALMQSKNDSSTWADDEKSDTMKTKSFVIKQESSGTWSDADDENIKHVASIQGKNDSSAWADDEKSDTMKTKSLVIKQESSGTWSDADDENIKRVASIPNKNDSGAWADDERSDTIKTKTFVIKKKSDSWSTSQDKTKTSFTRKEQSSWTWSDVEDEAAEEMSHFNKGQASGIRSDMDDYDKKISDQEKREMSGTWSDADDYDKEKYSASLKMQKASACSDADYNAKKSAAHEKKQTYDMGSDFENKIKSAVFKKRETADTWSDVEDTKVGISAFKKQQDSRSCIRKDYAKPAVNERKHKRETQSKNKRDSSLDFNQDCATQCKQSGNVDHFISDFKARRDATWPSNTLSFEKRDSVKKWLDSVTNQPQSSSFISEQSETHLRSSFKNNKWKNSKYTRDPSFSTNSKNYSEDRKCDTKNNEYRQFSKTVRNPFDHENKCDDNIYKGKQYSSNKYTNKIEKFPGYKISKAERKSKQTVSKQLYSQNVEEERIWGSNDAGQLDPKNHDVIWGSGGAKQSATEDTDDYYMCRLKDFSSSTSNQKNSGDISIEVKQSDSSFEYDQSHKSKIKLEDGSCPIVCDQIDSKNIVSDCSFSPNQCVDTAAVTKEVHIFFPAMSHACKSEIDVLAESGTINTGNSNENMTPAIGTEKFVDEADDSSWVTTSDSSVTSVNILDAEHA